MWWRLYPLKSPSPLYPPPSPLHTHTHHAKGRVVEGGSEALAVPQLPLSRAQLPCGGAVRGAHQPRAGGVQAGGSGARVLRVGPVCRGRGVRGCWGVGCERRACPRAGASLQAGQKGWVGGGSMRGRPCALLAPHPLPPPHPSHPPRAPRPCAPPARASPARANVCMQRWVRRSHSRSRPSWLSVSTCAWGAGRKEVGGARG